MSLAEHWNNKWANIPDVIDVYRGDSTGLLPKMTNVTWDEMTAQRFGNVTHYQVSKWDIVKYGYVNYASSFNEGEIFIFDTNILKVIP